MKSERGRRISLAAFAFFMLAFVGGTSWAADTAGGSISVTAAIESGNETMAGQPVRLRYDFSDATQSGLSIQTDDDIAWCSFELRQGDRVVSSWHPRFRSRAGIYSVPIHVLGLTSPQQTTVLTSSELTQVPPGAYQLHVHVTLPYGQPWTLHSPVLETRQGPCAERSIDLPIVVKVADEGLFRKQITHQFNEIHRAGDYATRTALVKELAKMPAEYAAGTWRSLLLDRSIDSQVRYQIADALASMPTKDMADTLFYVQFTDPIRDTDGKIVTLVDLINGIGMSGSRELDKYVAQEMLKHRDSPFMTPMIYD